MAKKKKGIKYWDDKAWKEFSQYIRRRDSKMFLDEYPEATEGTVKCITCNNVGQAISNKRGGGMFQAGHYISRTVKNIKYNEKNVNAQCVSCNKGLEGNRPIYISTIDIKYGDGTAHELLELQRKYRAGDYELMKADYYEEKYHYYKKLNEVYKMGAGDYLTQVTLEDLPF